MTWRMAKHTMNRINSNSLVTSTSLARTGVLHLEEYSIGVNNVFSESRLSRGYQSFKTFLRTVDGWPLAGDPFDEKAFDWQKSIDKLSMTSLFKISTIPD